MTQIFIGLTGTFGSGKGTFASLLRKIVGEENCAFYSLSDEVRAQCASEGKTLERSNLRAVANDTRKKEGPSVFARRVLEKIFKEKNRKLIVIDSVRAPAEAQELRRVLGEKFALVAVDAPIELRYSRVKERARAQEHLLSLEDFKESEEVEMRAKDEFGQSLAEVMASADYTIENVGTREELEKKAKELLGKLGAIS